MNDDRGTNPTPAGLYLGTQKQPTLLIEWIGIALAIDLAIGIGFTKAIALTLDGAKAIGTILAKNFASKRVVAGRGLKLIDVCLRHGRLVESRACILPGILLHLLQKVSCFFLGSWNRFTVRFAKCIGH